MNILHRYVLRLLLRNLAIALMVFVFLFLVFDFFDRIDNILAEGASVLLTVQYFFFKVPHILTLMFPVAMMVAILFTVGLLSKSSEITAMRAAGITVRSIAMPMFAVGIILSIGSLIINETVVPYSQRRAKEIYNIDIRQKDKRGGYSQSEFWWRAKNRFFSVDTFDSRSNELLGFSMFELSPAFKTQRRTDAARVRWVTRELGWSMQEVSEVRFDRPEHPRETAFRSLPLPIKEAPSDFYELRTEPSTMTIAQLRRFIRQQAQNGIEVSEYVPYLSEKFAFPFFNFVIVLVVIPFALRPARSGSMASSVLAGLIIGFSYYAVHSFSMAMGKAEILSPAFSAWIANLLMGAIGSVLLLGAESPH